MIIIPIDNYINYACPSCKKVIELFTSRPDGKCINCSHRDLKIRFVKQSFLSLLNVVLILILIPFTPFLAFIRAISEAESQLQSLEKTTQSIFMAVMGYIILSIPITFILTWWNFVLLPKLIFQNWMRNIRILKSINAIELVK